MQNTFIPTFRPQLLYCVWIKTGNPAHPLDRVWIDRELRNLQFLSVGSPAPIRAKNEECEPEALGSASPRMGSSPSSCS
jgi:hypothetical protein